MRLTSRISHEIDQRMYRFFYHLGHTISKHPWKVVFLTLAFVAICATGYLNFQIEADSEKLYVPQSAQSFADRVYVKSTWDYEPRVINIFLTPKQKGANVLTRDMLLALLDVHDVLVDHTATYDGETLTLSSLCVPSSLPPSLLSTLPSPPPPSFSCRSSSLLHLFSFNRTLLSSLSDSDILHTINNPPSPLPSQNSPQFYTVENLPMGLFTIANPITRESVSNKIAGAGALRATYQLTEHRFPKGGASRDWRAAEWEVTLADAVKGWQSELAVANLITEGGFDEVSDRAILDDATKLCFGFLFMGVYAMSVFWRRNLVYSQTNLAWASMLSLGLAVFAAYGIVSNILSFSLVVHASIFLLLGVGMDDAFVIMNSLRLTEVNVDKHERIARALGDSGPSIVVTSLTACVAFAVGSYSSLPAINAFCAYAAFGVFFDLLFQVTFFIALVSIDYERQKNVRLDCACCFIVEGHDDNDCITGRTFDETNRGHLTQLICKTLSKFICKGQVKISVLLIAIGLVVAGANGAWRLKADYDFEWFIPRDGNYMRQAYDVRDEFFAARFLIQWIFTKEGNYFADESKLTQMSNDVHTIPGIISDSVDNWHIAYSQWLNSTTSVSVPQNQEEYVQNVRQFLASDVGAGYKNFVLFSADNSSIVATKIEFITIGREDLTFAIRTMDAARKVAEELEPTISATAYTFYYHYLDGMAVMSRELLRNLLMAGFTVVIVCASIFNLQLSILIMFVLAMIDVEVLGFLYYAGLGYNPVTVINCIIAVGLAVDYNVHMAHAYMIQEGSRDEKVHKAIMRIAPAVLMGAISTVLGVVAMSIAKSVIFQTFFNVIAAIVAIALFHGLFFVPVVLSLVGPHVPPPPLKAQSTDPIAGSITPIARVMYVI